MADRCPDFLTEDEGIGITKSRDNGIEAVALVYAVYQVKVVMVKTPFEDRSNATDKLRQDMKNKKVQMPAVLEAELKKLCTK